MIQFAAPQYLLLIFAVPLFFIIYALYRRNRNRNISAIGDMDVILKLMPARSKYKGWVKITLFAIAWFFFVIGLSRPQIGARLKESSRTGSEIIVALDVSNSMLAQDYSPNRLERAKLAISRLVDRLREDRIGLVIFAGDSFVQLPITSDYVSAKIFLNSIGSGSIPVQGTALADAIYTSMRSFSGEGQMGKNNKAVILITDGENHEDDPVIAAKNAFEEGIRVFCIGIGSPEGKPIPMPETGELLKDKDGNIVVTKLDETTLEEIASAGGGAYVRAGNTEFGLNPILDELNKLSSEEFKTQVFEDFDEQYMYFFAIALFFLLLEFAVGDIRSGRKLFTVVAIMLLSSSAAVAQSDKKDVRRGNRLFEKENYKEAEVEYRKGLLQDSLSLPARYNLGNTLYKLNDAAAAQNSYLQIADSVAKMEREINWKRGEVETVSPLQSHLFHNLGNAYLAQKNYGEAVEAFKNALRVNPGDVETKTNLAYAQKMLENQQNQQNQSQNQDNDKNQDQDRNQNKNQDQNKDQNKDNRNDDRGNNGDNEDNQDNKENNNGQQPKISPQTAEQMLQAIQQKENQTQDKVKKEKARLLQSKQKEKNW